LRGARLSADGDDRVGKSKPHQNLAGFISSQQSVFTPKGESFRSRPDLCKHLFDVPCFLGSHIQARWRLLVVGVFELDERLIDPLSAVMTAPDPSTQALRLHESTSGERGTQSVQGLRVLCIMRRFRWFGGWMMRVLFIAMVVVGLIGFASMVAFVLAR
jgi:hypothetical protein